MLKSLNNFITDRYYKMSDEELEKEASKWKIREYGYRSGAINRQIIIDALLKKDNANNARYAFMLSIIAILVSFISLFI